RGARGAAPDGGRATRVLGSRYAAVGGTRAVRRRASGGPHHPVPVRQRLLGPPPRRESRPIRSPAPQAVDGAGSVGKGAGTLGQGAGSGEQGAGRAEGLTRLLLSAPCSLLPVQHFSHLPRQRIRHEG